MRIQIIHNAIVDKLVEEVNKFIEEIELSGGVITDVETFIDTRVIPLNSYSSPHNYSIIKYET
jgi:hypothetical protein